MTKPITDSAIIAAWPWPYSIPELLYGFRSFGTPTTADHLKQVWSAAQARGDLPPIDRPEGGFDRQRSAFLVSFLQEAGVTRPCNCMRRVAA